MNHKSAAMLYAERTDGPFETESDAADYIDSLLDLAKDLFAVSKEGPGTLQYSRPQQPKTDMRIDRILHPRKKLLQSGWRFGVVGIEIKKSMHPAGPLVAQAQDYMRSAFTFESSGVSVVLNSIFLFPAFAAGGGLASILAQNRIGFAGEHNGRLSLTLNNASLLRYEGDGVFRIGSCGQLNCGMKVGSR